MTSEIQITPTSTLEITEEKQEFNWRKCWYPVCFAQDLPKDHPYSFSLYDESFVLFKNKDRQLICLTDRCPHRAARLSDGQIIDGKIECSYHGWQFGQDGQCLHIPQLPADVKIPVNACVESFKVVEHQGIIWIWAQAGEAAVEELIPTLADLENPIFVSTDYMRDLPYDQSYFIENVIDPAHIPISHDGIMGRRDDAQPLEMEVIESSNKGIRGRYKYTRTPNASWNSLDFIAPNLIIYKINIVQKGWLGGVALYSIPLGKDRCRILLRNYGNFFTWKLKNMPLWLDHILVRNKILEGDLQLVVQQKAQVEHLGQNLKQVYLPLKTSDTLLIEYRKWLDKFGSSLPFYQGYASAKNIDKSEPNLNLTPLDRFSQHTQICSSCNQAYQITNKLKQTFIGVAIALAAIAILVDNYPLKIATVSAALLTVGLAVFAQKLKTQFERSYTRH
ncbi:Rieske 2Fe-2S domain-containing protein [Nostocaceae cyanobacterium CENA357]|uniref:Rieske 2Fe-2S domain-containing protein n=1 Tax=Atlanticothrix silvestris CENA357 TaxID=1725252 RepID=A0A8J7HHE8_9CYAN|nr:Rieske 2Fe-2S domain-containing protein [Atlanticothrix silvestris]MBH8554728.1 Rieske 2Fe-2S domain-containing protein [Atlanticothrix silvestris CENA357]